jgi:hypothetical protein
VLESHPGAQPNLQSGPWNFRGHNALAASNVIINAWVETAPTADSFWPSGSSSQSRQFTWKASSPSGNSNLSEVFGLFNTSVSGLCGSFLT